MQSDHSEHQLPGNENGGEQQSSPTQRPEAECSESAGTHKTVKPGNKRPPWPDKTLIDLPISIDLIAAVGMLAAIFSAVFAGCQISLSREAMMREHRAWVTIKTIRRHGGLSYGQAPFIELMLTNSGQSPALRVRALEANSAFERPCDPHTHSGVPAGTELSEAVIAPNAEYPQGYFHSALSAEEANALRAETKTLYFWGAFQYEDVFGKQHLTWYCLQYSEPFTRIIPPIDKPPFGWCSCHNGAN